MEYTIEAWEITVKEIGAVDCVRPDRFELLENDYERGNTERPGHDIYRVAGYSTDGTECFHLEEISEGSFDPKPVEKRRIRDVRQVRLLKTNGEWFEFALDRLAK